MKKALLIFIICNFFYFNHFITNSQTNDCLTKTFAGSIFNIQYPSTFPMYSLDMPYEVLLSYIALDTVCYYGNLNEFNDFIERLEYDDTLKTIMKHYYLTVDWDPLRFFQTKFYKDTTMKIPQFAIIQAINNKIKEKSEFPNLDYVICNFDYIAHIRVIDTIDWVDNDESEYSWAKYGATVIGEIIEPIKGKIIPNYNLNLMNKYPKLGTQSTTITEPGELMVFDYCYNWRRKSNDDTFVVMKDSTGNPWVKKGKEYIVFLKLVAKCVDNNNIVYYLRPIEFDNSSTGYLYPIENGLVIYPLDDLGIGIGLTVEDFKDSIKNRIDQISNYVPE